MSCTAIIVAAGKGTRFNSEREEPPKQLQLLLGKPMLSWTVGAFERCAQIDNVVIVTSENWMEHIQKLLASERFTKKVSFCAGGSERSLSVLAGLNACPIGTEIVAVHDGARPLVSPELIAHVIAAARTHGAALAALPSSDTVKEVEGTSVRRTLPRQTIYLAQTPQAFRIDVLRRAFREWNDTQSASAMTDDVQLVERLGLPVHVVTGERENIKVTVAEDMALAEWYLRRRGANE